MPTSAQIATLYIGIEPPANPNPATRWISQSARHVQPPHSAFARTPIIGSGAVGTGATSATQEISPWYNSTLSRYECLVNISSSQYFSYAATPAGPWSAPIKVLGSGSGGEASNSQQCSVLLEGSTLFAYYTTGTGATVLKMASAPLPTTLGALPAFTAIGTVYDNNTARLGDSSWIVKNPAGGYYLFFPNNIQPAIAVSTASDPTQFIAQPFKKASNRITGLNFNVGARYISSFGRPQVFYENGQWVAFYHSGGTDAWSCNVFRWTCTDAGIPVNWVPDPVRFLEQMHPLEVDQVADFRMLRGANDKMYGFWSGCNNQAVKFSIMSAPMQESVMGYDGTDWTPTSYLPNPQAGPQYINPDCGINGPFTAQNMWDIFAKTDTTNCPVTFPIASGHAHIKVTNAPSSIANVFLLPLIPANSTDVIMGGNPITAISAVGTTVTVTTKRPHNLSITDLVTVTGNTPNTYNMSGVAVASVPAVNSFTYVATGSPAASTILGAYDVALNPGETGRWRCRNAGIWVRD